MKDQHQDTSTEREALKPCPFCGKTHTLKITTAQELSEQDSDYDGEFWQHSDSFAVICDASSPNGPGGCGASGGFFPTEAEAVAAWQRRAAPASRDEAAQQHPDDEAVDRFAKRMRWKLAQARAKGRSGWQDRAWPPEAISQALREHVEKGDPTDVANYCMFLAARNEPIYPAAQQPQGQAVSDEQIASIVRAVEDKDKVPSFSNGFYTLTPEELSAFTSSILALRDKPATAPDGTRRHTEQRRMTKQLWAAAELAILVQHQHSDAAAHAALRRAGYRRTMNAVSARINRMRKAQEKGTQ